MLYGLWHRNSRGHVPVKIDKIFKDLSNVVGIANNILECRYEERIYKINAILDGEIL